MLQRELDQNPLQPFGGWSRISENLFAMMLRSRTSYEQELLLGKGEFLQDQLLLLPVDENLPVECLEESKMDPQPPTA